MDNYHKNLETIARGKGSPQARDHDEECEMCNEEEKDETEGGQNERNKV